MRKKEENYSRDQLRKKELVIGVDGGGTKTLAALADLKGKIIRLGEAGPSSPRNIGVKAAGENIAKAISLALGKNEAVSTFIGLAAIREQPEYKKELKKEILKEKGISSRLKGKIEISSDQLVAFRSGTDEKEGMVLISGTGSAAYGWHKGKEAKVSGWGWLDDEGSAFWVGQKAFQAVLKDLDGRGPKTEMTKALLRAVEAKNAEDFIAEIYANNPLTAIPLFSVFCDFSSRGNDKVAKKIMEEAGKELALSAKTLIKKLGFTRKKFPLIIVGSMFKSEIVLAIVKKEVRALAKEVEFIRPEKPVVGAIKLAILNT